MQRTQYRGAVRDSAVEDGRDLRMLALKELGISTPVIAQRMGVTVASVRARIKRARHQRDRAAADVHPPPSGRPRDDAP